VGADGIEPPTFAV